jgi:hypothetical protein
MQNKIIFIINVIVGSLGGTTNIQTIFDIPYTGFQVPTIVDLNMLDNVLHITPHEKIQLINSGYLGCQAIGPLLPIHHPAISLSR